MSTNITLKTEKINIKRRQLADLLVSLFGVYSIKADTYVFDTTFAQMAGVLAIDGSLISRLLAPPNLEKPTKNTVSEKSYTTVLKIVKALIEQKKTLVESHQTEIELLQKRLSKQASEIKRLKEQKPVNNRWQLGVAASLLLLCTIVYYINYSKSSIATASYPSTSHDQSAKKNEPKSSYTIPPNLALETILNPSFEEDEVNRAWTHWSNSNLGGVLQPTPTTVLEGKMAAKLPRTGDRIGYQTIRVVKNTDYVLSFNYLMRGSPSGSLTMAILADEVNNREDITAATIKSKTINYEPRYKNSYQMDSLEFNSGNDTEVSIYFYNQDIQCKLDVLELKRKN